MQPINLAVAIGTAVELEGIKECGASFLYPDGLTAYEWACLRGVVRGRADHNDRDAMKRMREAEKKAKHSDLAAKVRPRG